MARRAQADEADERVALLEVAKKAVFADIRKAFDGRQLLPPDQWPDDLAVAIKHWDAGGPQSSEKITMHDQPALALKLLEELRPLQAPPSPVTVTTVTNNVRVNVDKALVELRALLPK